MRIEDMLPEGRPVNLSRRGMFAAAGAGLFLGLALPARRPAAQGSAAAALRHATKVGVYLRIAPDGVVHLQNPFVEGGQGIDSAIAQIVAEELDADPARFSVTCAPAGEDFRVMQGGNARFTGGSFSVRSSFAHFRTLGATARAMLVEAASARLAVPAGTLATEPGRVVHAATGRALAYGELAEAAAALAPPANVPLKDPAGFRLIGRPQPRLDVRARSTGKVTYAIDVKVDGMLLAAVVHAPRAGAQPAAVTNEAALRALPGVHSVHRLPGAVAVVADSWWRAKKAADQAQIAWAALQGPVMAEDFSPAAMLDRLKAAAGTPGNTAEEAGDLRAALAGAARVIEAEYDAPYLAHAQMEPASATARFNADGSLDVWVPNQAPDFFRASAARAAQLEPEKVRIHSPPLGGFFGRHFAYGPANAHPQAILLAKATGRPVKVIWSREEEFARDAYRPLSFATFRAGLDAAGEIVAFQAAGYGEGPIARHFGAARLGNPPVDGSVMEGLTGKPYRFAAKRVEFVPVPHPPGVNLGFWRSVGHSMNDFFFESFLDEIAAAANRDPFALRMGLLAHSERHCALLQAAADLSGGWRRGPFTAADGTRRARGVAMASPFGSEVATIAEVSVHEGEVVVHDLWVAIDPGRAVNPRTIEEQVQSAAAIGLSSALMEAIGFERGEVTTRNFDTYQVLRRDRMPRVHTRIVESDAPMGGVGEPGTPGVPPAVANAVFALTGQRLRSMPFDRTRLSGA
ncbi:xanthine dehydrogenase family protein molybdopterin-binding subunit [Roseomonas sp. PWR1]|uniref:Xanthine dehydrogenase family protein molybdopterin-binding subunit n=1 Tax=Roseomonas nitratireducens TaxID=2820810 RepID=A0ABS4ARV5_9PROT|nr:molybdopterin cofactor-binding domain-containing protein [Neoroseomonas nitratireducens]MBP0464094.1 xanthine dehydrogenase family protein molybdopterin-binding subunit [Neoroseomonas nitratireducens]